MDEGAETEIGPWPKGREKAGGVAPVAIGEIEGIPKAGADGRADGVGIDEGVSGANIPLGDGPVSGP
ncbi:MAG: hypothetical protein ACOYON_08600 [Fimbriimonas sp.]